MKKRNWVLVISFLIGCLIVPFASATETKMRGYFAFGGEWLIPVVLVVMVYVAMEIVKGIKAMRNETAEMPDEEDEE